MVVSRSLYCSVQGSRLRPENRAGSALAGRPGGRAAGPANNHYAEIRDFERIFPIYMCTSSSLPAQSQTESAAASVSEGCGPASFSVSSHQFVNLNWNVFYFERHILLGMGQMLETP